MTLPARGREPRHGHLVPPGAQPRAFGAGAGERVQVHCAGDGGRTLIQEVSVYLAGAIGPEAPVAGLILAADPVTPGCPRGVVDPAGLQ